MFRIITDKYLILLGLLAVLLMAGCSQSETIVADQESSEPDEAAADTAGQQEADFQQVVIGEFHPISSLDPLFAENTSTMRSLQLLYEGLVRLNRNSEIEAGMARSWEVSSDSTRFTFTLKDNIYYHDSSAFSNGIGRRMVAEDIRFIFERMAWLTVPNYAAEMFMDIRGFEPYFREQQQVYNPELRRVQGISGIETPNDSTIVFTLTESDPRFLQKLASPYALIYPREAVVPGAPSSFKPVGTGPFSFSQVQDSNRIILSRFDEYYGRDNIEPNRIDVLVNTNESDLFKSFASGNIHLIPQIGPRMAENLLTADGRLQSSYRNIYRLHINEGHLSVRLNYHSESSLNRQQAGYLSTRTDSTFIPAAAATNFFEISVIGNNDSLQSAPPALPNTINMVYTDNPYGTWISNKLNEKIGGQQSNIAVQNIYVPTRDTDIYYTTHFPFYSTDTSAMSSNVLLEFRIRHLGLSQQNAGNIRFNSFPWWIDLRTTTISSD